MILRSREKDAIDDFRFSKIKSGNTFPTVRFVMVPWPIYILLVGESPNPPRRGHWLRSVVRTVRTGKAPKIAGCVS